MGDTIPVGYGENMEPSTEKLPEWIQASAALLLLVIIFLGGWWLQMKEKKDRAAEKQRLEQAASENKDA